MSLLLITAGAYLADELAAEFGLIPPAFLPVGNKRLYCLQSSVARNNADRIVMTVPETFKIPQHDAALLRHLKIETLPVIERLSLGESIVYAINILGLNNVPVKILHGDTVITDVSDVIDDGFTVHRSEAFYHWANYDFDKHGVMRFWTACYHDHVGSSKEVLSGYFAFSTSTGLVQAITRAGGDFICGLEKYSELRPLSPIKNSGEWLDFGHTQTYFASRWFLTKQRSFNKLEIDRLSVTKRSNWDEKIRAEAEWFRQLPADLSVYTPQLVRTTDQECDGFAYTLGHEHLSTLSDLYVFGRLDREIWSRIFNGCAEFLSACSEYSHDTDLALQVSNLYYVKPYQRLEAYCANSGIDLNAEWIVDGHPTPSLAMALTELVDLVDTDVGYMPAVMHGDFCFSNIFYDFRRSAIKVIDPRGHVDAGNPTIFGDARYDLAKLAHSVVGRYDFIMAGYYHCERHSKYNISLALPQDPLIATIEGEFLDSNFAGISPQAISIRASTALLFLSMLPLHADRPERQNALLARGLRLYLDLQEIS